MPKYRPWWRKYEIGFDRRPVPEDETAEERWARRSSEAQRTPTGWALRPIGPALEGLYRWVAARLRRRGK